VSVPLYEQRDQPDGVPPLDLTGERTLPDVPEEQHWLEEGLATYVEPIARAKVGIIPEGEVWRGLIDPEVLKASIPGCETIEKAADNEYKVELVAAIGPVKAKFKGKLVLSDIKAPDSYSLAFEGSGGAAGFAKGSAQVSLSPEGRGTRLRYSAKANIGGKLAQVGSRLIDGVAAKTADDFFANFKATLAPQAAASEAAAQAVAAVGEAPAPGRINPLWIVAGVIAAMLVVSWLLGAPRYIS
jgi:carbon monoxide dehydrogenase subunit G